MRIYFSWIQMSSFDCVPDMQFAISCIDGRIAVPRRLPPAPPCRCCSAGRPALTPPPSRLHFSCPDTRSVSVSALGNLCPSSLAMNENSVYSQTHCTAINAHTSMFNVLHETIKTPPNPAYM